MKRPQIFTIALAITVLFSINTAKASTPSSNYSYNYFYPAYYTYHYYSYYSYYYNRYATTNNNTNTTVASKESTSSQTAQPIGIYAPSQEEQKLISYINEERTKRGLPRLNVNLQLSEIAHLKAEDMLKNNYFSHISPTYGSPFDIMKKFGISYTMAGENIAKNSNIYKAHIALMNSEGHRANILNPSYTDVGVGVVHDNNGGIIVVEMFICR